MKKYACEVLQGRVDACCKEMEIKKVPIVKIELVKSDVVMVHLKRDNLVFTTVVLDIIRNENNMQGGLWYQSRYLNYPTLLRYVVNWVICRELAHIFCKDTQVQIGNSLSRITRKDTIEKVINAMKECRSDIIGVRAGERAELLHLEDKLEWVACYFYIENEETQSLKNGRLPRKERIDAVKYCVETNTQTGILFCKEDAEYLLDVCSMTYNVKREEVLKYMRTKSKKDKNSKVREWYEDWCTFYL